jgi:hypothetical protein
MSRRALACLAPCLVATCAHASGQEGAALVTPVLWIVMSLLVAFIAQVFGSGAREAFRAGRRGDPVLKGLAQVALKRFLRSAWCAQRGSRC